MSLSPHDAYDKAAHLMLEALAELAMKTMTNSEYALEDRQDILDVFLWVSVDIMRRMTQKEAYIAMRTLPKAHAAAQRQHATQENH